MQNSDAICPHPLPTLPAVVVAVVPLTGEPVVSVVVAVAVFVEDGSGILDVTVVEREIVVVVVTIIAVAITRGT